MDTITTAELTLGQMWLFRFLTAIGGVGIRGQEGQDFAGSARGSLPVHLPVDPTLTKPLRADKATGTYFCQGLFAIYEGRLFLWCK